MICSSNGRKSVARVLCLLRNIRTRLKSCGEGGLDVARAATDSIVSLDSVDSTKVIQENIESTPTVQTATNITSTNSKAAANTTTNNSTSGANLLQQRNLNEKTVFASMAKTAGDMLLRK